MICRNSKPPITSEAIPPTLIIVQWPHNLHLTAGNQSQVRAVKEKDPVYLADSSQRSPVNINTETRWARNKAPFQGHLRVTALILLFWESINRVVCLYILCVNKWELIYRMKQKCSLRQMFFFGYLFYKCKP